MDFWVRADKVAGDEAAQEILRLRRRVEELEADITATQTSAPAGTSALAQGDDLTYVRASFRTYVRTDQDALDFHQWSHELFSVTWNDLFYALSPLMLNEASKLSLKNRYEKFAKDTVEAELSRQREPYKSHALYGSFVNADLDEFETALIQFNALGLIAQSTKARSVKQTGDFWTLTPYGRAVMNRLRAVLRPGQTAPEI